MKHEQLRPFLDGTGHIHSEAAPAPHATFDPVTLARLLWRGKVWILLAAIAFGGLAWSYANLIAVPKYTARATIALDHRQAPMIDFQAAVSGLTGDQATINTEAEVLRSRLLIGQLVDELDLAADPEFNPVLAAEPSGEAALRGRDATIDRATEAISITNLRASYVFSITATSRSPEIAAGLANGLADIYIRNQSQTKAEALASGTEWLSERVASLKTELQSAEADIARYAAQAELISPQALEILNRQIKETRARLADLQARRDGPANRVSAEPNMPAAQPGEARGGDLSAGAPLDRGAQSTTGGLGAELARSDSQIALLEGALATLETSYARQSGDLVALEQLEREAEALRAIYQHFLVRLQETTVQQGIQQPDSRVLSYAVRPDTPSEPVASRIVGLAALLGLILGGAGFVARENLRTGFRTGEEIERETGLQVIGQIPLVTARKRRDIVDYLVKNPTSAAAESVRNLRTSVLLSNLDRPPQIIVSTSSLSGEGKTTTAIALAHNLSGLRKKVLLIEGDIRRRVFRDYFSFETTTGLLSVLSGAARFEAAVEHIAPIGIDVLQGEESSANAADIFSSDRFAQFVTDVRQRYDFVIIDTPPVLLVPDGRIIARMADAILFTVKWDATSRAQVREANRQFSLAGLSITGAILNIVDPKGMKRYGLAEAGGAYGHHANRYYSD
jgi:polysaccharide biosynthesis transport protein